MKTYKADLHIHTVLSPCANLEMSPVNIVMSALQKGLDIIGITDHNSTRQCRMVVQLGEKHGLTVFPGVEVTTKEEIHCLVYFDTFEKMDDFQQYLDEHLPDIANDVDLFGYQVVVDALENITYEEPRLLISAINRSLDHVVAKAAAMDCICIPAHIDKTKYSIISQLGFIPADLHVDAVELTKHTTTEAFNRTHGYRTPYTVVRSSDAHQPGDVGEQYTLLTMEKPTVEEFKLALQRSGGRNVEEAA